MRPFHSKPFPVMLLKRPWMYIAHTTMSVRGHEMEMRFCHLNALHPMNQPAMKSTVPASIVADPVVSPSDRSSIRAAMGESAIWSSTTTAMTIGRSIVIFGGITPAIDRSMPLNDSFAVLYIRHAECFERSMNEYFFPLRTKSLTIPISSQISPFILSYPPVSS